MSDVVVLVREDVPRERRLVAYGVSGGKSPPATDDLRALLRASLPEVMVPSAWVWLAKLPRTPNGKLDRSQLPPPERDRGDFDTGFVEPRTPTERTLAAIWQKVLDVDRIGVHDNFFDLGGHSLLLLTVIGEVENQLGVRLDPGDLVRPTLGQLASLCEDHENRPPKTGPDNMVRRIVRALKRRPAAGADATR